MSGKYYRLSGKFSPIGLVIALAIGLVGVAVGSWIYGYVMAWIPIVYVCVLGVIGYGVGAAALIGFGLTTGKVRNMPVALGIGAIVGAFAVYAGWVTWLFAWSSQEYFVADPGVLFSIIQELAKEGVWSMSGGTPTGWGLYLFWIAEALIIFGACVFGAYTAMDSSPFCEACECWMEDEVALAVFATKPGFDSIKKGLELERLDTLKDLTPLHEVGVEFTVASAESCAQCSNYHLLSFKEKTITLDKDGEPQTKEVDLMKRLVVNQKMLDAVTARGTEGEPSEPEESAETTGEEETDL